MMHLVPKMRLQETTGSAPPDQAGMGGAGSDDIIEGSVWSFDPAEGLGFIRPIDPGPLVLARAEIFLAAGIHRAISGARVRLRAIREEPYWLASEILSIDEMTAMLPMRYRHPSEAEPESEWQHATCKSFNWLRGIGILALQSDASEISVHALTVKRCGLVQLVPNQEVLVVWGRSTKGRMAAELAPWPAPKPGIISDTMDLRSRRAASASSEPLEYPDRARKAIAPRQDGPHLKDLAGMDEAVGWGTALAADLKDFRKGKIAWRDVDPGAVLHGPPGTGKTLFAQALARTCDIAFFPTSYSDWQRSHDGYLGDVHRSIHEVFENAKAAAPSILFIDELDAIPARGRNRHNDAWWTSIVNALLEELDGVASRDGVVVIGACNNVSIVDKAILRAGRLDRLISMTLPSPKALHGILRYHLAKEHPRLKNLKDIAVLAAGMTGADIAKLVREAKRKARHANRPLLKSDLVNVLCQKTSAPVRYRRAVHEAGHAVAALLSGYAREVTASIVPRDGRGGQTSFVFSDEVESTRAALERTLLVLLAGRAAEEVVLGEISGGAGGDPQSDLARATQLASDMIVNLGLVEQLSWHGQRQPDETSLFQSGTATKVEALLQKAYRNAIELIAAQQRKVHAVADGLLKRNGLDHAEIAALIKRCGNNDENSSTS